MGLALLISNTAPKSIIWPAVPGDILTLLAPTLVVINFNSEFIGFVKSSWAGKTIWSPIFKSGLLPVKE